MQWVRYDHNAAGGQGTSGANGAQLSYAYVQPLADPSLWLQLPKLLLSPDSPLSLRLRFDPWQWAWGLRFLAACRTSVSRRTTGRLLALAADTVIAEPEIIVPVGVISPDIVRTPAPLVDFLVARHHPINPTHANP